VNWVDVAIISVVVFSAMLAFSRGLVREILGIGSWVGAGLVAVWAFPFVRAQFRQWFNAPDVADSAGFGAVFLVALLVLSIVSGVIGSAVRASLLGGLDRTFGVVFGIVRGAGILAVSYILIGIVVPLERWPDEVQQARTLPFVYRGAALLVSILPEDYRPVVHVPPGVHVTRAADLLRVAPQGRAIARP
jgi:membrane protein required for colicin V production